MPDPWRGYDRCQGPCALRLIEHGTDSPVLPENSNLDQSLTFFPFASNLG